MCVVITFKWKNLFITIKEDFSCHSLWSINKKKCTIRSKDVASLFTAPAFASDKVQSEMMPFSPILKTEWQEYTDSLYDHF